MLLPLFTAISWLLIWIFVSIQNKLHILQNIYIFILTFLIEIHVYWIAIEELNKIHVPHQTDKYLCYLLYRNIIFPLIIAIFINALTARKSLWGRILTTVCTISALTFIEILCVSLNIFIYRNWNFYYSVINILAMHILAYCLLSIYRKIFSIGVQ